MTPGQLAQSGWSKTDVAEIRAGADIAQAINSVRELRFVSVAGSRPQTTSRNTARRGDAGTRSGATTKQPPRVTPEALYAEADRLGWSRDETIKQLKVFGYIT
jgi:hypothetical protein